MPSNKYSCKFVVRKDIVRADGTTPVYLQVFLNGKRKRLATGIRISHSEFLKSKQRVRIKNDATYTDKLNAVLDKLESRTKDIFADSLYNQEPLTFEVFTELLFNEGLRLDFYVFLEKQLNDPDLIAARAEDTIKGYWRDYRRLKRFRSSLRFDEIDLALVQKFDLWLRGTAKLKPSTCASMHKYFQKWLNVAAQNNKGFKSPYNNFSFSFPRSESPHLSANELAVFVNAYKLHRDNRVLRQFLFMCFTGLRISDMKRIKHEDVLGDFLIFQPKKTRQSLTLHRVPLSDFAKQLIKDGVGEKAIFDTYKKDQNFNRALKLLAYSIGITQDMTSHMGRHTYATMFLRLGGKVEVLQKILAHSDIKDTMTYVHVTNEDRQEQNQAFDDLYHLGKVKVN